MPYLSIGLGYDYATPRAKLLPKICLYNFLMCFGLLKIAECNQKNDIWASIHNLAFHFFILNSNSSMHRRGNE